MKKLLESNRRVRVLFVPEWYPNAEHKFFGTFCREHVHAAALYDDVAVLVYTSRSQRRPTMHWKRVEDHGVPTFYATYGHSPIPKTTLPFFHFHFGRALRRVIREWGEPDVVHTQDSYAYYVIKSLANFRIPIVISQHWSGFMKRSLDRKEVRHFRYAFAHAKRVLPANRFADAYYRQYDLKAQVRWLPNTIATEIFWSPSKPQKEPWLLHASGFTPEKRFPDIIQAFARVRATRPEAVLQVVGEGPNRHEMEALAGHELPPGSYYFHGYLPKSQLADLMRRASGFVLPSEVENLPCVLIEAMACGCPVLSTRVGGIPDLLARGGGLLVEVENIEQIAEGMRKLLDGTHGFDMARISREIREQFSHESVGRILHEEYTRAATECFEHERRTASSTPGRITTII
jgi:glycosyltransferase involved in cell wall biosynthesis